MNDNLTKMLLAAGVPIDLSKRIREVSEAREVPKTKRDLMPAEPKYEKAKARACKNAIKHIKTAIALLEKAPATDFSGDIPRFIAELEELVTDMEEYHSSITNEDVSTETQPEETEKEDDAYEIEFSVDTSAEDKKPTTESKEEKEENKEEKEEEEEKEDKKEKSDKDKKDEEKKEEKDEDKEEKEEKKEEDTENKLFKEIVKLVKELIKNNQMQESVDTLKQKYGKQLVEAALEVVYAFDNQKTSPGNVFVTDKKASTIYDRINEPRREGPSQLKSKDQFENSKDKNKDVGDDLTKKVKVPPRIKKMLKDEIEKAKSEAEKLDVTEKDSAKFYKQLANAFQDILNHLEKGTMYDLKRAQVYAQSLMGPMLHKLPADVWLYLTNGGEINSLKAYMMGKKR